MLEITPEQQKEAEEFTEGLTKLRKDMNLKEVRMLKKCQEDPTDTQGILAGVLWIYQRRANPSLTFDDVLLKYNDDSLVKALKELIATV